MNDLHRAFYHELGHLVAHEIEKRYFGAPGTKSIELNHYPHNQDIRGGDTKVNFSENEKEKNLSPTERIAEYLAPSTFRCLFKCHLLNQSLSECLKIEGHGRDDNKQ